LELEGPAPDDLRDVATHPQAPDEILPATILDTASAKLGDLAADFDLPRPGGPGGDECGRPSARRWTRSVSLIFGSYIWPVPSPGWNLQADPARPLSPKWVHPFG